ncbi:MAG: NusG domain II-containing protein [Lachnospiraceae bacterium]|nr:NusG domain II-containing protein [Lachnospiraceae bacterium]
MKHSDRILVLAVLAASVLLFFGVRVVRGQKSGTADSLQVSVSVDGEEKEVLPLSKDVNVRIEGRGGNSLMVHIEGGEVYVTDATCPDKLCVHQGRIRTSGEMIVCMPARIVVEIL